MRVHTNMHTYMHAYICAHICKHVAPEQNATCDNMIPRIVRGIHSSYKPSRLFNYHPIACLFCWFLNNLSLIASANIPKIWMGILAEAKIIFVLFDSI